MDTQITVPVLFIDLLKLIGSPVFLGWFASVVLNNTPVFQKLAPSYKFIVVILVSAAFAALSYALVTYTPSAFIEAIQTWYGQIVPVVVFVAATWWHENQNKKTPPVVITTQPVDETNSKAQG